MRESSGSRIRLLALAVTWAASVAGCGNTIEADGPAGLSGYFLPSCGPADGPAVEIYIATQVDTLADPLAWVDSIGRPGSAATTHTVGSPAVFSGYLWQSADRLGGRTFEFAGDGRDWGTGSICAPGAGCAAVRSGRLHFDRVDVESMTGEVEVRAADGQTVAGRFRVTRVERAFLCG